MVPVETIGESAVSKPTRVLEPRVFKSKSRFAENLPEVIEAMCRR